MSKNALILMTALLPTTGHMELINFAAQLPDTNVWVLINGRSFEPIPLSLRTNSISRHFSGHVNVTVRGSLNDLAPQNPADHDEFWEWWAGEIQDNFPEVVKWDYVVASEPYGLTLAKTLHAAFLPYDIERELNPIKGEAVRVALSSNWESILQEIKPHLMLTATMFGQESVGKTTLTKLVAEHISGQGIFEYARPYLEFMGDEINEEAMEAIHLGQAALQQGKREEALSSILIQDTDLFSTVGYWEIMLEGGPNNLIIDALRLKSDIYYLLPDDVPFEVDSLRYGVDKRESTLDFWRALLIKYKLNYVEVPRGSLESKVVFIVNSLLKEQARKGVKIKDFIRD